MKIPSKRKEDYSEDDDRLVCKICGKKCNHLGSHIWHKHKIRTIDYKNEFGLPHNFSLISQSVYDKKSSHFKANKEYYLNNLINAGKKYRFKKGVPMPSGQYRSERQVKKSLNNINKINGANKIEECPVCHKYFKRLASHLYNKHRLVQVLN